LSFGARVRGIGAMFDDRHRIVKRAAPNLRAAYAFHHIICLRIIRYRIDERGGVWRDFAVSSSSRQRT
jgi:hypothetical protein